MIKPESLILDVTAGNRMMWAHLQDKDSKYIMFTDKQEGLKVAPDIICNWRRLPFPDNRFLVVVFDPPHAWGFGVNSIHSDPMASEGSWWGNPSRRKELVLDMIHGQKEFARVAPVLCFKWNDNCMSLERALSCLTEWKEVFRKEVNSSGKLGKSKTWWITMTSINSKSKRTSIDTKQLRTSNKTP